MAAPRAIVFDWDNTLIDSWATIHEALALTFTAMGRVPWTIEETKARVRHSLRDAFPPLFGERWGEAQMRYLDHFAAIHLERLRPISGAAELLAEIDAAGLFMAVLSNKTGRLLRREVDHLGWTGRFANLVGAGDAPADKPDTAAMRLALAGSGADGAAVWYIGDTAIDMECAARAGCVGILVGTPDAADQGFVAFPPARRFASLIELGRHLEAAPGLGSTGTP